MNVKIISALILCCYVSAIYGQSVGTTSGQSECQIARARAARSNSVINLVPNCEANGQYSALQCHSNSTWCQCWKPDGTPVTQPSRKTKRCECHLQKNQVQSAGGPANPGGAIGAYVPTCAPNGGYASKQCHGSTGHCWCSTNDGVQQGEKVRGALTCP